MPGGRAEKGKIKQAGILTSIAFLPGLMLVFDQTAETQLYRIAGSRQIEAETGLTALVIALQALLTEGHISFFGGRNQAMHTFLGLIGKTGEKDYRLVISENGIKIIAEKNFQALIAVVS